MTVTTDAPAAVAQEEDFEVYVGLGQRIREAEQQVADANYALADAWWAVVQQINSVYGEPKLGPGGMPEAAAQLIAGKIGYSVQTVRTHRSHLSDIRSIGELHQLVDELGSYTAVVNRRKVSDVHSNRDKAAKHTTKWLNDLRREMSWTKKQAAEAVQYYLDTTTWEHIAEVWEANKSQRTR